MPHSKIDFRLVRAEDSKTLVCEDIEYAKDHGLKIVIDHLEMVVPVADLKDSPYKRITNKIDAGGQAVFDLPSMELETYTIAGKQTTFTTGKL